MEFNGDKSLNKLKSSGFIPSTPYEAIVVGIHSILLTAGLTCVYEQASTVKGFSGSITELPPRNFLPPNWNQDPTVISLMYKYRPLPGKQYSFVAINYDDMISLTFTQRGGESSNLEFQLSEYVTEWTPETRDINSMYQNVEELNYRIRTEVNKFIPQITPNPSTSTTTTATTTNSTIPPPTYIPPLAPQRSFITPNPYAPVAPVGNTSNPTNPTYPGPPSVGANDLDPFSNIRQPFYPTPTIGQPAGGNLVGPDHPIFQPPSNGYEEEYYGYDPNYSGGGFGSAGFLPGFQPPQPRFDPYGPIPTPNNDVNVGDVGIDARGRLTGPGRGLIIPGRAGRGGRGGRGGGGANSLFPGEPNPDHFKPPGW